MKREDVVAYYVDILENVGEAYTNALIARRNVIIEAYRNGLTKKDIALAVALSDTTVRKLLMAAGEI